MSVRIPIEFRDRGALSSQSWDENPTDPEATQRDIATVPTSFPGEWQRNALFRVQTVLHDPTFELPVMGYQGTAPVLGVGQSVQLLTCTGGWEHFVDSLMVGVAASVRRQEMVLDLHLGGRKGFLVFKVGLVRWEGGARIQWGDSVLGEKNWRELLAMVEMRKGQDVLLVHVDLELNRERMNISQKLDERDERRKQG